MTVPTSRLLQLLSLLEVQPEWSGPELAERLGVSPRTLRRDVEKLRELDYPVESVRGRTGGYRLGSGGRLPPLQLVEDEAVAAAIGLRTAASSSVHGVGEAALRALVKLQQVMPNRLRARVSGLETTMIHVPSAAVVDPDALMTLAGACRDRFRVRFDYVRADGAASSREAEPYQLVSWMGQWYLVAWDLGRADWRSFRVDRMRIKIPLGRRFEPRPVPGGDGAAFLLDHVGRLWGEKALVRIYAPVESAEVQRYRRIGEVEAESPTTALLRISGDRRPSRPTSRRSRPTLRSSSRRSSPAISAGRRSGSAAPPGCGRSTGVPRAPRAQSRALVDPPRLPGAQVRAGRWRSGCAHGTGNPLEPWRLPLGRYLPARVLTGIGGGERR